MVAHAFDDGLHARIADAETLPGDAVDVGGAGGGAVEGDVPGDDLLLGLELRSLGRVDDDLAAGEALADVIVGVTLEFEGHAVRTEGTEGLARTTLELEMDRVLGQARAAMVARHLAAGDGADNAVDVDDGQLELHLLASLDRGFAEGEEMRVVEGLVETVVLRLLAVGAHFGIDVGLVEDRGQIDALGLPVFGGVLGVEALDVADHLIDGAEAELGHVFAQLRGDEGHEIHDMLGLAGEVLAQLRILGGDADGTGVLLADAHHETAHRDERCGRETILLGSEKGGDGDIATGLELAVGLEDNAAAEVVEEKNLIRLGESELPGSTGVVDRRGRRSPRATVVTGDEDDVGMRLRHA